MEIKITTKQILNVLLVISYIIFFGLCITAGGIIFNFIFTLFLDSIAAKNFWKLADLSNLLAFNKSYFITETVLMIIVSVLQSILFYMIVKILHHKKLDLRNPFNTEMTRFISKASYLTLGIGFFANWGTNYTKWLISQGVIMPDLESLRLGGADVWLFMGITLLVIAQIFKRGEEMQSENELTI